jgi:hypothetical protein
MFDGGVNTVRCLVSENKLLTFSDNTNVRSVGPPGPKESKITPF